MSGDTVRLLAPKFEQHVFADGRQLRKVSDESWALCDIHGRHLYYVRHEDVVIESSISAQQIRMRTNGNGAARA